MLDCALECCKNYCAGIQMMSFGRSWTVFTLANDRLLSHSELAAAVNGT